MLNKIREFIRENNLDAMLVNSTNEFLAEYSSLEENSRYILTGFSGSTGDAVVTPDRVYLFVDGRYHIQADNEVNHDVVTVVKLQTGETFLGKLRELLPEKSVFGVTASKNSQSRIEDFEKYYVVRLLEEDGRERELPPEKENIENIDINLCGKTSGDKISKITAQIHENDAVLVTNPEEVSYLFNMRDFSAPCSSTITRRAVISKKNAKLFGKSDFENYKTELLNIKGDVFVDKATINGRDFRLIKDRAACFEKNPIRQMKSCKTDAEISHYIEAFNKTDSVLKAIREYIENNDNISEYDIAGRLEKEFMRSGAKGLSFMPIVAKDKNSALAHYSRASKDEIITEGSLVLIDCGAYYEGGLATDITRVFVKGNPDKLQKKVYTAVLKVFLNTFNTKIETGTCGFDIDAKARELFGQNIIEGFVFNHGLGHGIGISVHECPPNLSCNELAKTPLEENMCFTIEPGLYNRECFGVRLENSCYLKNGKINSFVKMNFEKKLINAEELSDNEILWLKDFEVI